MPCSKYTEKQRRLCFATDKFTDFSRVRKRNTELNEAKMQIDGIGIAGITSNNLGANMFS